jgi:hypothetical protein
LPRGVLDRDQAEAPVGPGGVDEDVRCGGVEFAGVVGDGPTVLGLVDAVGDDFEVRQGICGKDGQNVPAALGSPTLRIARITVGGTG